MCIRDRDSALLNDSKPFFIPDFSQQVDYETELVVRINRLGKNIAPRFASRYYDAVTVGIDFTAVSYTHLISILSSRHKIKDIVSALFIFG